MPEDIDDTCEAIKNDIGIGKCVLILGPDIYVKEIGDENWDRKQYFRKIDKDRADITYFEKDEVFNTNTGIHLENKINSFFSGKGDLSLLELISTIKFPLILNASPDESLRNYLQDNVKDAGFDYFQGERDQKKLLTIELNQPLLYNVFGAISDPQSLIISHDSLYRAMQERLPKNSFPPRIQDFLRNARSFLFLGFKFESWSYQLISYKILKENETQKERMIRLSSSDQLAQKIYQGKKEGSEVIDKDQSVNIIMTSAMGMSFTEYSPSQLLNKIIKLLKDSGKDNLLRTLNKVEKHTAFLSYAHENDSNPKIEAIIRILEKRFNSDPGSKFKLAYDNKDLPYGQSVDSFMTRIGRGKTVILVVSDKYLKSDYCMIEALRVQKYNNEDGRVFVILIEDSLSVIGKQLNSEYYKMHWKNELSKLASKNETPKKNKIIDFLDIAEYITLFTDKIEGYKHFRMRIEDLTGDQTTGFSLSEPKQTEFNNFLWDIFEKMKED